MATDARGHTVPTGSDFAARKSITDLSLSIPSIYSAASQSAADLYRTSLPTPPTVAAPCYVWRSDLSGIQVHDGSGWAPVLGRDTGWVTVYDVSATATVRARTLDRTLWVRAVVQGISSGWTCPNKLPVEMRPQWAGSYVYVLIAEGSGSNNIAKMGVRADGSLWFRTYGASTSIDGLTSVPL